jgi:hypothetical protein
MRLRSAISVAILTGLVASACSSTMAPRDPVVVDGSAVVYGRITSTSGIVVPGATVIVEFYPDTTRMFSVLQCSGPQFVTANQQLNATGDYRLEVVMPGGAGQKVCVEVTGDPHGLYSDIGLKRQYAGWVELRDATGSAAPNELHADVHYTETP